MLNFDSWIYPDPQPGVPIDQISSFLQKADALVARNRHLAILKDNFVNIVGAIEMMKGMQYHHDNFVKLYDALPGFPTEYSDMDNEIVAYFNRVGQFYYFCRSEFVRRELGDVGTVLPIICKYIIFRNKFSAHRSIDAPKNESDEAQIAHARALTSSFGAILTPRPGEQMPNFDMSGEMTIERLATHLSFVRSKHFRSYQTYNEELSSHVTFTLQIEHPRFLTEAYGVFEKLIK